MKQYKPLLRLTANGDIEPERSDSVRKAAHVLLVFPYRQGIGRLQFPRQASAQGVQP